MEIHSFHHNCLPHPCPVRCITTVLKHGVFEGPTIILDNTDAAEAKPLAKKKQKERQ